MDIKQLYTDLILEYNQDTTNRRTIENPTVHEHGHNPNCGDDIDISMVVENGVIKMELVKGRTLEEARHLVNLFLGMIRGDVTDDSQLEELEAACTLKDISKMPVRVKCAVLAWHTLDMILDRLGKDKKQ